MASSSTSRNEATDAQTCRAHAEVRRIVQTAYDEVSALLGEHRDQLDALADRLMERETLDEADAYAAAGIEHANDESATRSREERNEP